MCEGSGERESNAGHRLFGVCRTVWALPNSAVMQSCFSAEVFGDGAANHPSTSRPAGRPRRGGAGLLAGDLGISGRIVARHVAVGALQRSGWWPSKPEPVLQVLYPSILRGRPIEFCSRPGSD